MKKSIFILLILYLTLIINPASAQKVGEYNTCKQVAVYYHNSIVKCDEKYGVYDKHNKQFIIEPNFDAVQKASMYNTQMKGYITILNNKKGLLSYDGTELLPPIFDSISLYYADEPDRLKITKDNKLGIYSFKKKKIIIQPIYEKVNVFDDNNNRFYQVSNKLENKIINFNGELISEFKIDASKCITKQKCIVEKDTKSGLYDIENNKYILEPKFDEIISKNNIIQVSQNKLKGLYTLDGKLILDVEFNSINPYFTDTNQINGILVQKNNKYGIYDGENGKYILEPNYENIELRTYKTTNIDKDGILVYRVLRDNKMRLIDSTGQDLLGEKFEYISNPEDTRFSAICPDKLLVKYNGKFGIYNAMTNSYLIEPNFDKIVLHENKKYHNTWEVKNADKVGLLDESGNMIFDTIYDSFEFFYKKERYIGVEYHKKFGVYDRKKQKLSKFIYDDVTLNDLDELVVKKGNNKNLYTPIVSSLKTAGYIIIWIPLMPIGLCVFGIIPIIGVMMQ